MRLVAVISFACTLDKPYHCTMNSIRHLIAIVLCQLLLAQGVAWAAPMVDCDHGEAAISVSAMPCHHGEAAASEHDCCQPAAMALDCDCGCELAGAALAMSGVLLSAEPPVALAKLLISPSLLAAQPDHLLRPPRA